MRTPKKKVAENFIKAFVEIHEESLVPNRKSKS